MQSNAPGSPPTPLGYRSILVGVDFTPSSATAIREGLHLASTSKAALRAVHVIDTAILVGLGEALTEFERAERDHVALNALLAHLPRELSAQRPDLRAALLSDAQAAWTHFVKDVPEAANLPLDVLIENRIAGLKQAGQRYSADLLILGAFGRKPPEVGFGTIATGCVRLFPGDVLLVRETQQPPFRRVVAAVDFSDTSARALRQAAQIALVSNAPLHVLHVTHAPWLRLPHRGRSVKQPPPELAVKYENSVRQQLEEFARVNLQPLGITPTVCEVFDRGGHRSAIVSYAQKVGADLIALGTHGRSNIRELLLGTTAERTLKYSTCSILAVKPA